ncbi:MAG: GNAT family N-acetyltransferase [Microbacteriaceae bacterium]
MGTSPTSRHRIRPAVSSDSDVVFELLAVLGQGISPERDSFDSNFASLLEQPATALVLVAEDGAGHVRGYAFTTVTRLLHRSGLTAHLQELVVDSSVADQGFGSALVDAIERACRELNVTQLTVASRRSAGFYERLGYRTTADFLKRTFD